MPECFTGRDRTLRDDTGGNEAHARPLIVNRERGRVAPWPRLHIPNKRDRNDTRPEEPAVSSADRFEWWWPRRRVYASGFRCIWPEGNIAERRTISPSNLVRTSRRGRAPTLLLASRRMSTPPRRPYLLAKMSRAMRRTRLRTVALPATLPKATIRRPPLGVTWPHTVKGPALARRPSRRRHPTLPLASRRFAIFP